LNIALISKKAKNCYYFNRPIFELRAAYTKFSQKVHFYVLLLIGQQTLFTKIYHSRKNISLAHFQYRRYSLIAHPLCLLLLKSAEVIITKEKLFVNRGLKFKVFSTECSAGSA